MEQAEFAPAKVNLFLRVVGRRADGYHLLDSLAVFPAVGDVVAIDRRRPGHPGVALSITGRFAAGLSGSTENLVARAASALARTSGRSPDIGLRLEKNLPVASGIGGGSADAAATLRLLARHWEVPLALSPEMGLGADVPVCVRSVPCRMQGIGERLDPVGDIPDCGIVLVNPGIGVSTPAVFAARSAAFSQEAEFPPISSNAAWQDARDLVRWLTPLGNDLEAPATMLCPAIAEALAMLRSTQDCLLARMSGSGATCFGLYPTPAAARTAADARVRAGWWIWGGGMSDRGLQTEAMRA